MKNKGSTLFKITGILAIISGALMCVNFWAIFPLFMGVPLIWGGVEFLKYADLTNEQIATKETPLIIWTVVFFVCSVYLGVLALIAWLQVKDTQINNNIKSTEVSGSVQPENTQTNTQQEPVQSEDRDVVIEKLTRLNKLKEDGLIGEEEYNSLKEDLLSKL